MPEGCFTGGEERVLTGVPPEKMRRAGVRGMVFAGSPDFMEKKSAGLVDTTMEVESQAALFLARRRNQGAEFRFEKHVLAFLGAERDDKSDRVFGELCDDRVPGAAPCRPSGGFAVFLFRHVGRDCTPNSFNRKENWETGDC